MYQVTLQHTRQGQDAAVFRSDVLSGRRQPLAAVSYSQLELVPRNTVAH